MSQVFNIEIDGQVYRPVIQGFMRYTSHGTDLEQYVQTTKIESPSMIDELTNIVYDYDYEF